jgi:hypothetical protein
VSAWLLGLVTLIQAGVLVSFIAKGAWTDAAYWTGVMFINGSLLWRAAH